MGASSAVNAVMFVRDLAIVSTFYRQVLGVAVLRGDEYHAVLDCSGFELMIHQIPPHLMPVVAPGEPVQRRERGAVRLDFAVQDLTHARSEARRLGGQIDERPPPWAPAGMNFFLAQDPEGNVFGVCA